MRLISLCTIAPILLVGTYSQASAAPAAGALAKKPTYAQSQALVEKACRGKRGARVYGYTYRPYRYRHWKRKWRRDY